MFKKIIINRILAATLSKMKGKKRWLAILVLAIASAVQASGLDLGVDLSDFVAELVNMISAEG